MADTARSIAALKALLADNSTGAISAQDLRDAVETLQINYGELYVSSSSATTVSDTSSYFDVAGTWSLGEARNFDESAGNGQLTYTGTPDVATVVFGQASVTVAGNNDVVHLRIEKNGSSVAGSNATQKLATGADVATMVVFGIVGLSNGDVLTLAVRNETAADDVTASGAHLVAVGMAT